MFIFDSQIDNTMKKLTLFALIFGFAFTLSAQEEEKKEEKAQSFGVSADIYTDIWMDAPEDIDLRLIHQGINFGGMFQSRFGKSPFSIAVGSVISTHNMYSNAQLTTDDEGNSVFVTLSDEDGNEYDYKRNKLTLAYIDFPLEFRFKTESGFRAAAGFKAGFLVNSHTKYRGDDFLFDGDEELRLKLADLPNIETARYGVLMRLGYKMVNLYGFYSLSTVFSEGQGPAIYPVSVGLSLRPF